MKEAELGFYDRVSQDAEMITLVGTKASGRANVRPGWPSARLAEERLPLVTYFDASDSIRARGFADVRLRVDIWVWPEGEEGGAGRLRAIEERLQELINEQTWSYGDCRLYAIALNGRTIPAPPDAPLHRSRDYRISVSPGLPGT